MKFLRSPCGILAGLALTACSPAVDPPSASQPTADASRPDPAAQAAAASPAAIHAVAPIGAAPVDAAPAGPTAPVASAAVTAPSPLVDAINAAGPPGDTAAAAGDAGRDSLIRLEVLLDRAGFSPGVIDGRPGGNLKAAIAAWQASRGLPADGTATPAVWDGLTRADPRPVATRYVLTADDVKGPFIGSAPSDMEAMAKLERLGFTLFASELLNDDARHPQILDGLEEFRQHLGGELTITLLRGIGQGAETHEMHPELVLAAIAELQDRARHHEPAGRH